MPRLRPTAFDPRPDTFVAHSAPYTLPPRNDDPNRSPLTVRLHLETFYFITDEHDTTLVDRSSGYSAYVEEPPATGSAFGMTVWVYGRPTAPDRTSYVLSHLRNGHVVRTAADPEILTSWSQSVVTHPRVPITAEERARVAAAWALVPPEDRGRIWAGGEEVRERQTPEGLLRLRVIEYPDDPDSSYTLTQLIGGQEVEIPIQDWTMLHPFRHQLTSEEEEDRRKSEAALDRLSAELHGVVPATDTPADPPVDSAALTPMTEAAAPTAHGGSPR